MHIVHLRFAWAFDTDTDMDTDMYMDTRQELSDYQTMDESGGTAQRFTKSHVLES
jgi:hypothetical protein